MAVGVRDHGRRAPRPLRASPTLGDTSVSFKTGLIKLAIKMTPKGMVLWVANKKLKGVAQLTDFSVDLDTRKAYVKTLLHGEVEPIEVLLEDFAIIQDGDSYHFILRQATSNKPWISNALAHITGKAWKIPPPPPRFAPQMALVSELLADRSPNPQA